MHGLQHHEGYRECGDIFEEETSFISNWLAKFCINMKQYGYI